MSQQNGFDWGTAVAVIFPAITGLGGILFGAHLSRKWQREQWRADNKKAEYRELLTALSKTANTIVDLDRPWVALGPDEQRLLADLKVHAVAVIMDRIFIAQEVKEMRLLERWSTVVGDFERYHKGGVFGKEFGYITNDIMQHAFALMKERSWLEWLEQSAFADKFREMEPKE